MYWDEGLTFHCATQQSRCSKKSCSCVSRAPTAAIETPRFVVGPALEAN